MKRRTILAVALLASGLAFLAGWLWFPSHVPEGQQPLVTLSDANASEFTAAFDQAPAAPRLVLLVSPT
jgi:hypothetical protein